MFSVNDLREIEFKTGRGYKAEDVDIFVDQVAADYEVLMREINNLKAENGRLSEEIKNTACSQSSLQNVLISAQRLADQIVEEAKQKAEEILTEAKTSALQIQAQIEADKESCKEHIIKANDSAQKEIDKLLKDGVKRTEAMKTAAADSVDRQQLLFDKLKVEIVSFKKQITDMYKEHLSLLSQIPDEVPFDADRAAKAVNAIIDAEPDFGDMLNNGAAPQADEEPVQEPPQEEVQTAQEQNAAKETDEQEDLGLTRVMDIPDEAEDAE